MPKDLNGLVPVSPVGKKNMEHETNKVTLAAEKERRFPRSHTSDGNEQTNFNLSAVNKAGVTKIMAVVDGSAHLTPTARRSIVSAMRSILLEQSNTFERIAERQARKAKEQSEANMAVMENMLTLIVAVCKPEFPPAHPYHPQPSQPYHPVQLVVPQHSTTPSPQAGPSSDIHSGLHDEALRHLNPSFLSSVKPSTPAKKTWADYSCTAKYCTPSITMFKTTNAVRTYSTYSTATPPASSTGHDDEVVDLPNGQDPPTDIAQAAQVQAHLPQENVDLHPTDSVHQIRDWLTHNKILIVVSARTAQQQHKQQTHALHCSFKGVAHQKLSIYKTMSTLSQNKAKKLIKLHPSRLPSFLQHSQSAISCLPFILNHKTLSTAAQMQPRQHSISDLFPDHPG